MNTTDKNPELFELFHTIKYHGFRNPYPNGNKVSASLEMPDGKYISTNGIDKVDALNKLIKKYTWLIQS